MLDKNLDPYFDSPRSQNARRGYSEISDAKGSGGIDIKTEHTDLTKKMCEPKKKDMEIKNEALQAADNSKNDLFTNIRKSF